MTTSDSWYDNIEVEKEYVRAKYDVITETEHTFLEKDVIRIASWNLKSTSSQNYEKIHVIQTIINLIQPDVIALQELASPGNNTADEIIYGLDGSWKYHFVQDRPSSNTCLAFLWNNSRIEVTKRSYFFSKNRRFALYLAFSLGEFNFALVNFHLRPFYHKAHSAEIQRLHKILDMVKEKGEEENCCSILVGDFNEYPCNDELKKRLYENVIRPHQYTNLIGTHCYDNLIVPYSLYLRRTGQEVYKHGLIQQPYFDHYPVVANFYC